MGMKTVLQRYCYRNPYRPFTVCMASGEQATAMNRYSASLIGDGDVLVVCDSTKERTYYLAVRYIQWVRVIGSELPEPPDEDTD